MLYPNNKTDFNDIDWAERIKAVSQWDVSEKYDGIRLELVFNNKYCEAYTRSMKPFRSLWVKVLATQLSNKVDGNFVMEGEIYSESCRFNELQHFILSEDVTSDKSKRKYYRLWERSHQGRAKDKHGKDIWPFPGRDYLWAITYPTDLGVYLFGFCSEEYQSYMERKRLLEMTYVNLRHHKLSLITQYKYYDLEPILKRYENIIEEGGEGLILSNRHSMYKFGRITLKENDAYKMKDEFNIYEGIILYVEEGTQVIEGTPTTTNELGRSVTSKKKDDREPSGKAKGFYVRMDDGRELTVTLKGFDDYAKVALWNKPGNWMQRRIQFLAMKPTKVGGVPRMAKYIK